MTIEPRCLQDFLGDWSLERVISHDDGTTATFSGQCSWRKSDGGAVYSETGTLTMPGQPPMAAERRYVWADDLSVSFEDGRFFHTVPPTGGRAEHWCAPDTYVVDYDFGQWPVFITTWAVSGPRKGYRMTTIYRRL